LKNVSSWPVVPQTLRRVSARCGPLVLTATLRDEASPALQKLRQNMEAAGKSDGVKAMKTHIARAADEAF
jgi:hypothetical protein